jgi:hypothetical protein
MQLPNDQIDAFIDLCDRAFGEVITRDQARAKAHQLIEFYRAVAEDLRSEQQAATPPPSAEGQTPAGPTGGGRGAHVEPKRAL